MVRSKVREESRKEAHAEGGKDEEGERGKGKGRVSRLHFITRESQNETKDLNSM